MTRADELGFLASNQEDLLAYLGQPPCEWLLSGVDLAQVEPARLVKVVRIILKVLLWRLVQGIKRTIEANVPVLVALLILVTVVRVRSLKVVNDALLDSWFHPGLLLDQRGQRELQTNLAL